MFDNEFYNKNMDLLLQLTRNSLEDFTYTDEDHTNTLSEINERKNLPLSTLNTYNKLRDTVNNVPEVRGSNGSYNSVDAISAGLVRENAAIAGASTSEYSGSLPDAFLNTEYADTEASRLKFTDPKAMHKGYMGTLSELTKLDSYGNIVEEDMVRKYYSGNTVLIPKAEQEAYYKSKGLDLKSDEPITYFEMMHRADIALKRKQLETNMAMFSATGNTTLLDQIDTIKTSLGASMMGTPFDTALTVTMMVLPEAAVGILGKSAQAVSGAVKAERLLNAASEIRTAKSMTQAINLVGRTTDTTGREAAKMFLKAKALQAGGYQTNVAKTLTKLSGLEYNQLNAGWKTTIDGLMWAGIDVPISGAKRSYSDATGMNYYTFNDQLQEIIMSGALGAVLPGTLRQIGKHIGIRPFELTMKALDDTETNIKVKMATGELDMIEGQQHLKVLKETRDGFEKARKSFKEPPPLIQQASDILQKTNVSSDTLKARFAYVLECFRAGKMPKISELPQGESVFSHIDGTVLSKLLDDKLSVRDIFGSSLTITKTGSGLLKAHIIGENGLLGRVPIYGISEQDIFDQIKAMYKGFVLEGANEESVSLRAFVDMARKNTELANEFDRIISDMIKAGDNKEELQKLKLRNQVEDALLKYFLKDGKEEQLPNRISDVDIYYFSEHEQIEATDLHETNAKLIGGNYKEAYQQAKELAEQLTWYDAKAEAMKVKNTIQAKQWFREIREMSDNSTLLADSDNFMKGERFEKIKEAIEKTDLFEISEDTNLRYIFGTPRKTIEEVQQLAENADSLQQLIDREKLDYDNIDIPESRQRAKSKLNANANEENSSNGIYKANNKLINVVKNSKNTKHLDLKKAFFETIRTDNLFADMPDIIASFLDDTVNAHAVKRKVRLAMSKALDKGSLGVLLNSETKRAILNNATDAFLKELESNKDIAKALNTPEVLRDSIPTLQERTMFSESERLSAIEDFRKKREEARLDYAYEEGRIAANLESHEAEQGQAINRISDALAQVEKRIQDLKTSEKNVGKRKAEQIKKLMNTKKQLQEEYRYASETSYQQQAAEKGFVYDPDSMDALIQKIKTIDTKIQEKKTPSAKLSTVSKKLETAKTKLIKALENIKKESKSVHGKIADQIKKKRFYEGKIETEGTAYDKAVPEVPTEMVGKYERIPFERTDVFSKYSNGIENAKKAIEEFKKVPDIKEMGDLAKFFDDQIKLEEQRLSDLQQEVAQQVKDVAEIQSNMDIIFEPFSNALDIELSKLELQAMHENKIMIDKMELMLANPEIAAEVLTASATQTIYDFKGASRNVEYIRRTANLYEKDIRNQLNALDKQNNGDLLVYYLTPSHREKIEEAIVYLKHGNDVSKFENTKAAQIAEVVLNSHATAYQGLVRMGSTYIKPLDLLDRSMLKYADKAIDDSFVADFKNILIMNVDEVLNLEINKEITRALSKFLKLKKSSDVKQALWAFTDFDLDAMFDKSVIAEYGFNKLRDDILDGRLPEVLQESNDAQRAAIKHDAQTIVDKIIGSRLNGEPSLKSWLRKFRTGFEDLGAVLDGSKSAFMDSNNSGIVFKSPEAEINAIRKFGHDNMEQAITKNFEQALKAEYSIKNFGYNPVGIAEDLMDSFERIRTGDVNFVADIEPKLKEARKTLSDIQITNAKRESVKNFIMDACGMREQAPTAPMQIMSSLKTLFSFPLLAKAGFKSKADYGNILEYMVNSNLMSRPEAFETIVRTRVFLQKNPELARLVGVTSMLETDRLLGSLLNDPSFSIAQHSEYLTSADKLNKITRNFVEGYWDKMFDISGATNRHKQVGAFCMMEAIAKHKDYTFKQLKDMGYWLEREGIDEAEWDIFRKYLIGDISPDKNAPYLVFNPLQLFNSIPDDEIRKMLQAKGVKNISDSAIVEAKKELRNKAYSVINSSVDEAMSMPSNRIMSLLRGGQVKGSWKAFAAETMTQYQAFPFTMAYNSYGKIAAHSVRGMTGITVLDMFNPLVKVAWENRKEMYGNIFATLTSIGLWMTLIDTLVEGATGQVETPVKEDGSINYGLFAKRIGNAMGPFGNVLDAALTGLDGSGQRGGGVSIQSTPAVAQLARFGYRQQKIWMSDKIDDKLEAAGAELTNEIARATSLKTLPIVAPIYQMTIGSYLDMLEQGGAKQWDTYIKGRSRRGYVIMPWEENPEPFNYAF